MIRSVVEESTAVSTFHWRASVSNRSRTGRLAATSGLSSRTMLFPPRTSFNAWLCLAASGALLFYHYPILAAPFPEAPVGAPPRVAEILFAPLRLILQATSRSLLDGRW